MRALFASLSLVLLLPLSPAARAADAKPGPADFFGLTKTYTFHFTFEAAEWDKMQPVNLGGFGRGGPMGGNGDDRYPTGTATMEVDGQAWGRLQLRFKGNSSFNFARSSLKRSLKLDFNELDSKARFFGLTKLNLNNDAMDHSALREALAYDVFRAAGVVAPRTALARVYLTVKGRFEREYAGAYTAVEQVNSAFLKDRFGKNDGLLLKPEQNAVLGYQGDDWQVYADTMGEKVEASAADGKRFVDFIRLLNRAPDDEFARGIGSFLDVDQFLKFVAVQAALVNYDSPLVSGHNYYLYLNPADHRFVWIPWDLNEAFAGFMSGSTPAQMSMRQPSAPGSFRLAERVLALPGSREKYDRIAAELLVGPFNAKRLGDQVARLAPVLREAVKGDPMIPAAEFERNVTADPASIAAPNPGQGPGRGGPGGMGGVKPPVLQFINQRAHAIADQLAGKADGVRPAGRAFGGQRGGPPRGGPGGGPQGGPGRGPGGNPPGRGGF
jgi:spore coat protein H